MTTAYCLSGLRTEDCLRLKVLTDLCFKEVYELGFHIVVEIGDTQDDESLSEINSGELFSYERPVQAG